MLPAHKRRAPRRERVRSISSRFSHASVAEACTTPRATLRSISLMALTASRSGRVALVSILLASCRPQPAPAPSFSFAHEVANARAEFDQARFRSFRKDGSLTTRVSMDGVETRYALVPPVPSRLEYAVDVPQDPRLDVAFGVSSFDDAAALPAPIEFRILIDAGSGEEVVFEETVRRRFANRWSEPAIDSEPLVREAGAHRLRNALSGDGVHAAGRFGRVVSRGMGEPRPSRRGGRTTQARLDSHLHRLPPRGPRRARMATAAKRRPLSTRSRRTESFSRTR